MTLKKKSEGKCYLDDELVVERGRVLVPPHGRSDDGVREDSRDPERLRWSSGV